MRESGLILAAPSASNFVNGVGTLGGRYIRDLHTLAVTE